MERIPVTHQIRVLGTALIIVILAGCQSTGKAPPPDKPSGFEVTQAVIGTSVGGSPITALVMGKGMEGALVIAGIRGNEPAAVTLARQMVEQLKMSESFPENRQIVIIPEVNPDAVLKNSRFNLKGRDINRDFISARPQPETQAVISAIDQYLPNLIISLRQLDAPGIDYDGPGAERIARDLSTMGILDINKWGASYGSIGYYAGLKKNIPVITLGLHPFSAADDASGVWERYGRLITAAVSVTRSGDIASQPSAPAVPSPPSRMKADRPKPSVAVPKKKADRPVPKVTKASPPPRKPSRRETPPKVIPEVNHYHEALKLYEAGDYLAARKQFEIHQQKKACEDCGSYVSKCDQAASSMAAGVGYLEESRYGEALSEFNIVLSLNPQDQRAKEYLFTSLHRLAGEQFSKGDYPAARENYAAAANVNRNCPDCRTRMTQSGQAEEILKKGRAYLDSGDDSRAIGEFEEIIALNPDMPAVRGYLGEAYLRRGKTAFAEGKYAEAESDFTAAERHNLDCRECGDLIEKSRDMAGWRESGIAYFEQGNHAKAVEVLAAAVAVNPRDPKVREVLYKAHFQLGRDLSEKKETLSGAITHYEASLKYNDICSKCQKIIRELIASAKEESNAYHYQQGKKFFLEGRKESLKKALKEWGMVDPDYKDVKKLEETATRLLESSAQ